MAKINPGLVGITGKVGDSIITRRGRYGSHIRKVVRPGTKKDEQALKEQYTRTASLNRLAAEVNAVMKELADDLKSSRFYVQLLSRFKKETSNNRLLLLRKLKGMDAHPTYPMAGYGLPDIRLITNRNELCVNLEILTHPICRVRGVNCYCFEVSLVTWDRTDNPPDCKRQYSDWVGITDDKPEFEFPFEKPDRAVHWILCIRLRFGVNNCPDKTFPAQAMQIVDTGSFDKREQAWLEELAVKPEMMEPEKRRERVVVERVKAKVKVVDK